MRQRIPALTFALWLAAAGCGNSTGSNGTPPANDSAGTADGAADAASGDAAAVDSAAVDAGTADAGTVDAGTVDAGTVDAGTGDSGQVDAGAVDSGAVDAGTTDSGPVDAGKPDTSGDGGCTSEQSCPQMQMCFVKGESIGCGMCQKPDNPCQADTDCPAAGGKPRICIWKKSDCMCGGEKACHDGCSADGDCAGPWQVCASNHHCVAKTCNATADCPALFTCDSGACKRQSCKSSGACQGGFCVNGQCHPDKGFCSYLPA